MAKVLLLGTWVTSLDRAKAEIERCSGGPVSFGGLAGQLEVSGPRIAITRDLIVNDRTWKHGMPRSITEGTIAQFTDDLFVVVDEPSEDEGRGRRRG